MAHFIGKTLVITDTRCQVKIKYKSGKFHASAIDIPYSMWEDIYYQYGGKDYECLCIDIQFTIVYQLEDQYTKYLRLCKELGIKPPTMIEIPQSNGGISVQYNAERLNSLLVCKYGDELFMVHKSLVTRFKSNLVL